MSAVNTQPLPSPWLTINNYQNNSHSNETRTTVSIPQLELPTYTNLKQQAQQFFSKLPLITSLIMLICICFYILDCIVWLSSTIRQELGIEQGGLGDNFFSLYPLKIIREHQVWRLLTYPFFHTRFFHLFFNLLATIPISILIEKQLGSIQYLHLLTTVLVIIPAILYTTLSMLLLKFGNPLPAAIGLSGLFFTLLVWQAKELPLTNPCVMCNIPSTTYPLVFLLVISLFLPIASFFGHFFGLAVGYAFAYGFLSFWCLREETILRIEELSFILTLSRIFSTRFISINERIFCSAEPTDLPSFNDGSTGRVGSTTNLLSNSGSGYISIFQNLLSRSNNNSFNTSNNNPLFPGQGRRLGGS